MDACAMTTLIAPHASPTLCSAKEYETAAAAAPPVQPLRRGDVAGVLRALRDDFDRAYFVTGQLSDEIYDEACFYADPTVSFTGGALAGQARQQATTWVLALRKRMHQAVPRRRPTDDDGYACGDADNRAAAEGAFPPAQLPAMQPSLHVTAAACNGRRTPSKPGRDCCMPLIVALLPRFIQTHAEACSPAPHALSVRGLPAQQPCERATNSQVYALPTAICMRYHAPAGRELYKRNLALLIPFLWDAAIELRGLQQLPPDTSAGGAAVSSSSSSGSAAAGTDLQRQGQEDQLAAVGWQTSLRGGSTARAAAGRDAPVQLLAEWRLTCWLRLPWAPYVAVNGTTTYTLNADQNKVGSSGITEEPTV